MNRAALSKEKTCAVSAKFKYMFFWNLMKHCVLHKCMSRWYLAKLWDCTVSSSWRLKSFLCLDVAGISALPQDSCHSTIQAAMSTENVSMDSTEVVFFCVGDKMTITKAICLCFIFSLLQNPFAYVRRGHLFRTCFH